MNRDEDRNLDDVHGDFRPLDSDGLVDTREGTVASITRVSERTARRAERTVRVRHEHTTAISFPGVIRAKHFLHRGDLVARARILHEEAVRVQVVLGVPGELDREAFTLCKVELQRNMSVARLRKGQVERHREFSS